MKNFFTLLLAFLFFGTITQAQTFWSEDFDTDENFFDWDNEDLSGQGALWTWCEGTAVGPTPECPSVWEGGSNNQVPFAALTSENGFITMDSDEVGGLPNNHFSQITTTEIDCSGKTGIGVQFQSHIGVFFLSADTGAVFSVSNDGVNWTDYLPHPTLNAWCHDPADPMPDLCRWSSNPSIVDIDISAVADGQSAVQLRWTWEGNFEYHWSIDDILVYENNTTAIEQVGDKSIGIQIAPMPVSNELNIELDFDKTFERAEVHVTNLVGKTIHTQLLDSGALNQELSIDLSNNASGIYFVSVIADGKVNTKKFILAE